MPSYFYEIPDVGSTIEKAVTDNVTKNVLANMGIESADIIYEGQENAQAQPNSTQGEKRKQSYGSSDRITVSVEEQRDPLSRIERAPGYYLENPFFHDPEHGVKLIPSMVKYDVTVTVKRRAPSKAVIQKWCNEIQRKTDMGRDMFPTHADFYYHIPIPALNLLKDCYETKFFEFDPRPYPLVGYFKKYFTDAVTLTASLGGHGEQYAVRVSEQRILGIFDTEGPKERKGDKLTNWECEFTFKFNYHRPEAVEAVFPIILNNTLMPREWWLDNLAPGLTDVEDAGASVFVQAAEHIITPPYLRLPVYIPECDKPELNIPTANTGDIKLGVIHLEMYPSDSAPNKLFNLGELGDEITLSQELLDYIRKSYSENPSGIDSILKVYVFENNYVVNQDKVAIDQNLDIYLNKVIRYNFIYRVVIVMELDWANVTDTGFDYLRRYPSLVDTINNEFRPQVSRDYPIDTERDRIPPAQLDEIIKEMGRYDELQHGQYGSAASMRDMITVHNNSIIAYRRSL